MLIERPSNDGWRPRHLELPGGKEEQEESPLTTLRREVLEETGLVVEVNPRPVHEGQYTFPEGKYRGNLYVVTTYLGTVGTTEVTLNIEHSGSNWLTLNEAFSRLLTEPTRDALTAHQHQTHT